MQNIYLNFLKFIFFRVHIKAQMCQSCFHHNIYLKILEVFWIVPGYFIQLRIPYILHKIFFIILCIFLLFSFMWNSWKSHRNIEVFSLYQTWLSFNWHKKHGNLNLVFEWHTILNMQIIYFNWIFVWAVLETSVFDCISKLTEIIAWIFHLTH